MKRLTNKNGNGISVHDIDEALKRLEQFENFYFDLIKEQKDISAQLEAMRENQQTKQYRYRELSAGKITNDMVIRMLKKYGIGD